MSSPATPVPSHASEAVRILASHLARDVVLPFAIYLVAQRLGTGAVLALALGGVWTALMLLGSLVWSRRVDVLALAVLGILAVGTAASLVSADPRFSVAKESILTGAVGVLFLVSLVTARSPMYYLCRTFVTKDEPAGVAHWEELWACSAPFRRVLRRLDAVWGIGLVAEASARLVATLALPLHTAIALSPILIIGTLTALMMWTGTQGTVLRTIERTASAR